MKCTLSLLIRCMILKKERRTFLIKHSYFHHKCCICDDVLYHYIPLNYPPKPFCCLFGRRIKIFNLKMSFLRYLGYAFGKDMSDTWTRGSIDAIQNFWLFGSTLWWPQNKSLLFQRQITKNGLWSGKQFGVSNIWKLPAGLKSTELTLTLTLTLTLKSQRQTDSYISWIELFDMCNLTQWCWCSVDFKLLTGLAERQGNYQITCSVRSEKYVDGSQRKNQLRGSS